MEKIGFLDAFPSALPARWDTRHVDNAMNRDADQANSDFAATLLAMAGHDLRQPLQVITSAHDVLARETPAQCFPYEVLKRLSHRFHASLDRERE